MNDIVDTPEGRAKVVEADILRETVKVRIFTGETDEDGQEKLGSDIVEFARDKVKKTQKGKKQAC